MKRMLLQRLFAGTMTSVVLITQPVMQAYAFEEAADTEEIPDEEETEEDLEEIEYYDVEEVLEEEEEPEEAEAEEARVASGEKGIGNTFSKEDAETGVTAVDADHTLKLETNAKGLFVSAEIRKNNGTVDKSINSYLANIVTEYENDGVTPKTFYTLVFTDGKWDTSYDSGEKGAYEYKGVEYFVAGGVVNQNANGLIYTGAAGWRFLAAGHVVTDNEGLVMYADKWFWIDAQGKCDDTYAAIVKWNGADFLVHGGRLRTDYSGFTYDPENKDDWYHIVNGQVWGDGKITDQSIEGGTITRNVVNGKVSGGEPKEYINPVTDKEFTVIPDDGIDDTAEINHALTVAAVDTDHHTVYLPAGVYDISIQGGEGKSALLFQYEGQKLIMDENAVLRLSSNGYHGYNAILVHADNVTIKGGQLIGERSGHSAGELGYGHGIAIDRAHAGIYDMKICSNRGDGIYLADWGSKVECYDVTIDNCEVYDNARSNISIVRADDVSITGCDLHGAYGTAPMAGLNIEPNRSSSGSFYCCNRITVKDTVFSSYQNVAPFLGDDGLWCGYAYLVLSHTGGIVATDVTLQNCTFNGAFDNGDTSGTYVKDCVFNGDIFERSPITY